MSAIAGIVCLNSNDRVSEEELIPMLEAMKPALPSKMETYAAAECSAVLGRVAYGADADNVSNKTVSSDVPQLLLVGELYNDETVQYDSCGDFLLERYRQSKVENFAGGLNGSFVAAIVDRINRSITLVTDHTASQALFTVTHGGRFYFASEVKGLLAVPEIPCRPDMVAVLSLAARGFFIGARTLVENIRQMDYATVCQIQDGKVRLWPYWRYIMEPEKDRGRKTYITELAELLHQAVQRRVRTGRCGVLLSGGFDTRGILACLDEPQKVQTVTYTAKTKQTRYKLGDWVLAEKVSASLGMKHSVFNFGSRDVLAALQEAVYCSDGAAGLIFENVWGRIKEQTGLEYALFGDTCMQFRTELKSDTQIFPHLGIPSPKSYPALQSLVRKEQFDVLVEQLDAEEETIIANCHGNIPVDRANELILRHNVHFYGPKRRVVTRYGLSVRCPWLDLDVLNFTRKAPVCYKKGKYLFANALRHLNPALFKLPIARTPEREDYYGHLCTIEREHNSVSAVVFDDNPFLEKFFNVSSVERFIQKVCLSPAPVSQSRRFDLRLFLPAALQSKLGSLRRSLTNFTPPLSSVGLLLRVMTVAETLRQLRSRFANKIS